MKAENLLPILLCALASCGPIAQKSADSCAPNITRDSAGAPSARVFALGLKQELPAMTSTAAYRRFVAKALAEQAKCFSSDIPNLVVLPEDTGLAAAFLGSRGQKAREQTDSLGAFATLFTAYQKPLNQYRRIFPGTPPIRLLLIALTDTLARAVEETFPPLAKEYGIYLAVSINIAPYQSSGDKALISALGDPESAGTKSVYVATAPEVYNVSIVYGPDGKEVGRVRKAYLVPAERDTLEMSFGTLEQLRPIQTSFARLAPVISKDAWMPDVLERFSELGADVTLQHEAFSGWAVEEQPGDWLPDVLQESLWSHVQAYSSFRYGILPCLTGNLFELVFDCQSAIAKQVSLGDKRRSFIGQETLAGYLDIGAWAFPDPIEAQPDIALDSRRRALRKLGLALLPGSGDIRENSYARSVATADLSRMREAGGLQIRPLSAAEFGARELLVAGDGKTENATHPDIAFDGTYYHVIWLNETAGSRNQVRYARIGSGGTSPIATLPLAGRSPYAARITATTTHVYAVAVQDNATGTASRLLLASSADSGASWFALPVTFTGEAHAARWNPAISAAGGRVYLAWTDRRNGSSDIYTAVSRNDGFTFASRRLDEDAVDEKIRGRALDTRNNQALPALASVSDSVAVSWTDFRSGAWDIYAAVSTDGAQTWSPNFRMNAQAEKIGEDETERIFGINSLAFTASGLVVAAEGVDNRGPNRRVWVLAPGCSPQPHTAVAVPCSAQTALAQGASYRPHLSTRAGQIFAVWQDLRDGDSNIYGQVLGAGDAQPLTRAAGTQFNPRSAGPAAVWEDWRSGRAQVVMAPFLQHEFFETP